MARNDVYLNINALSPADAVVTGQQDMTAATVPELVLGDTPTFNFYFTDNTNVWPSWAGNAAYTVTWALSDAVSGDFSPAATTGNATPITGGWSVVLPLNAYDLVGLLNTKRVSQPYPVTNLWQQIRVADPSGNEITRAMFWTPIRYRAISDTQNTESASPTGGREVTVDNVNVLTTPTAAQFYAANPVPTSALGSAANGELLIGNGTGFTKSTLTAGTGITVTNGSGSITIDASGAQETLTATVKNAESVAITKGQVVYLFGATGNMPSVKLAYNTSDATSAKTFGVVSDSSISAGGTGTVTCVGVVDGLNLGAYQDGDTLYLGATPGSVTATKPYAPNHLVYVGIVERANAGNGELYVRVQNGYELDEIHDVQINAPKQSGQTLIYDNTTSLWKNARITAGSNIAVTNGDGSISIGFSGTLPVANGGTGVTTSTGSGSVVLSTSPTLTTPILGTPQSGTLSSCTGLPISTGVSGLGTNVATFLATPSSANLASAVTDETGTGALVFANTPTLVTPNIGAATGTSVNLTGSGTLGTTLTVNSTTDSSSKDTGAIVTEGGLGVEKSASIGGNLTVSGGTATVGASGGGNGSLVLKRSSDGLTVGNLSVDTVNSLLNLGTAYSFATISTEGVERLRVGTITTTLAGNLTVSGTGTSSVAGNLNIGEPTGSGYRLYVKAGFGLALGGSYIECGEYDKPCSILNHTNPSVSANLFQIQKQGTGVFTVSSAGNLTVSGNTANFGGSDSSPVVNFKAADTGAVTLNFGGTTTPAKGRILYTDNSDAFLFYTNSTERMRLTSGGNLLIGTTADSGNGKLQLATHTTSAGGIGFGTDTSLYRTGTGSLAIDGGTLPILRFFNGATQYGYVYAGSSDGELACVTGPLRLKSNNTTALTLDSSQNATFAGTGQQSFNGIIQVAKTAAGANSNLLDLYNKGTTNNTSSGIAFSANNASSAQRTSAEIRGIMTVTTAGSEESELWFLTRGAGVASGTAALKIANTGNATFAGSIAIGNTVAAAAGVASTHKVTISIGGSTYYLLATNV